MSAPLTHKDLKDKGCAVTNCDHDHSILYLHCMDCIISGRADDLEVLYDKNLKALVVSCHCGRPVATFKIADE